MAGLYEFWKSPAGEWLATCTIITTSAADAVGHIHDRMPMTVPPDRWDAWLDPTLTDEACDLLQAPGGRVGEHTRCHAWSAPSATTAPS